MSFRPSPFAKKNINLFNPNLSLYNLYIILTFNNNHISGQVPVMLDDDFKLFESRAISRYLVNKYQGTKNSTILIPKDPQKASLVEQFLSVENCKFDKPSSIILHEEHYSKFSGKEANVERVKQEKEELEKVLDIYDKLLEGKEYLTGEYSLADL